MSAIHNSPPFPPLLPLPPRSQGHVAGSRGHAGVQVSLGDERGPDGHRQALGGHPQVRCGRSQVREDADGEAQVKRAAGGDGDESEVVLSSCFRIIIFNSVIVESIGDFYLLNADGNSIIMTFHFSHV